MLKFGLSATLLAVIAWPNTVLAEDWMPLLKDDVLSEWRASGGGESFHAKDGTLTIMVGGSDEAFARARPVLEAMGKLIVHAGPLGHGQMVKLINNAVAATNAAVLGEARRQKWTFEQAIEQKVFTIIGEGDIDFPKFFRTVAKNGYSGWFVVEQDVKFGDATIRPAESVAASLKYLRSVVNALDMEKAAS